MIEDILEVDYLDFFQELADDYIRYINDSGELVNDFIYEYIKNYGEEVYDNYAPDFNMKLNEVYKEFLASFKEAFPNAKKEFSFLKNRLGLNEGLIHFKDWLPEDIDLYKNIDWKARNYESYPVPGTEYEGRCYLYDEKGKKGIDEAFVKYINANPLFPPYYAPVDNIPGKEYTSAMYDGREKDGYKIHDRRESWELYRLLSDSLMSNGKNRLTEGTWACPYKKEDAEVILNIMKNPVTADVAENALWHIYGDDVFMDDLDDVKLVGSKRDVRPIIKKHIKKLVSQIDEHPEDFYDYDKDLKKSVKAIWEPEVVDILRKVADYKLTESIKMEEAGRDIDEVILDVYSDLSKQRYPYIGEIVDLIFQETDCKIPASILHNRVEYVLDNHNLPYKFDDEEESEEIKIEESKLIESNPITNKLSYVLNDFMMDMAQCYVPGLTYNMIANHDYTKEDLCILRKLARKCNLAGGDDDYIKETIVPEIQKMFAIPLKEAISKKKGLAFGTVLAKNSDKIAACRTKDELLNLVTELCKPQVNDPEQERYLTDMQNTIKSSSFQRGQSFIYNIILKGEGDGAI